ncbi:MAG: hypothetical protein SF028_14560 [Candidatus Sumerlaeia bacterium]|nr:hypothetical protein [Candidatus Sumerlaeia bacterium]
MAGVLCAIPACLRVPLLAEFEGAVRAFREGKWRASELDAGHFTEIAYAILASHVAGTWPSSLPPKPQNFLKACKDLEAAASTFPRSVRITVPRVLVSLYEFRNNRNVGHAGGDVDANEMDATFVLYSLKWVLAELVRIFHNTDLATATAVVESIIEREVPLVCEVAGVYRVLEPSLSMRDRMLAVLYASPGPMHEAKVVESVQYSNASVFRRDVIRKANADALVHYDERTRLVHLLPPGIRLVEEKLLARSTR